MSKRGGGYKKERHKKCLNGKTLLYEKKKNKKTHL